MFASLNLLLLQQRVVTVLLPSQDFDPHQYKL